MDDLDEYLKKIDLINSEEILDFYNNFNNIINTSDFDNNNFDIVINFLLLLKDSFHNDIELKIFLEKSKHNDIIRKIYELLFYHKIENDVNNLKIKQIKDIQILKLFNLKNQIYCLKFIDNMNKKTYINMDQNQLEIFMEKIKQSVVI